MLHSTNSGSEAKQYFKRGVFHRHTNEECDDMIQTQVHVKSNSIFFSFVFKKIHCREIVHFAAIILGELAIFALIFWKFRINSLCLLLTTAVAYSIFSGFSSYRQCEHSIRSLLTFVFNLSILNGLLLRVVNWISLRLKEIALRSQALGLLSASFAGLCKSENFIHKQSS